MVRGSTRPAEPRHRPRVARFDESGNEEIGHFIDENGNDFWGLIPWFDPRDGKRIILLSDRDSGLWIFRYTGP
jgi:hypothetical protein